jgi:UDP-N-acetylmuramate--alanine ligase
MIVKLLREAGIATGYIIGAELPGFGNATAGTAPYFVIEADEYDHMFLGLRPTVAVITNVEWDHPDCYPTPASFQAAFQAFVQRVPANGMIATCADDPGSDQLYHDRRNGGPSWITYGLEEFADLRATNLTTEANGLQRADLYWWHAPKGALQLAAPGLHNVRNALAALTVASWCDVPFAQAAASLRTFQGAARRFEYKGEINGVTVIDDYAHHPTKIRETLAAARRRYPTRRLWAVLQPHTYSRTRHLLAEFGQSLQAADQVLVTDIYAAREPDDGTVHARDVVAASAHPHIQYVPGLAQVADHLAAAVQPGDVVIIMGAGDSYRIGEMLLENLK